MLLRIAQPLQSRQDPSSRAASPTTGSFAPAARAPDPRVAPPIVREVVGGAGRALDAGSRAAFGPLLGHDFARIRVHADGRAAESARAIGARAYAVGESVVFGAGEYAPGTARGRRLIAHELAHVVQQRSAGPSPSRLEVGAHGAAPEREADAAAERAVAGRPVGALRPDPAPVVRRAPPEAGTGDAGAGTARPLVDRNWAGQTLTREERDALSTFLFQDVGVMAGAATGDVVGAQFLLHDTSGASSRAHIEEKAKEARGPMGSGPNVFIPASGAEIIQRPGFFDPRRPTTTEWEKGTDTMSEKQRDAGFRAVWKAAAAAEQSAAITRALAGLPLSATELKDEETAAAKQLSAAKGKVFTTASWAAEEICAEVGRRGAAAVAEKGKDADLTAACAAVRTLFADRRSRLSTTVSVELVQVGTRKGGENKNTCDPDNPDNLPLPNPAYTVDQYWNTTLMYLRAAIMAGRFPEVTTHFVADAFAGGHCDPRCFNLGHLYQLIAGVLAPLGHGPKSSYGVAPSYGTTSKTNTVWWHEKTCHGPPPAP